MKPVRIDIDVEDLMNPWAIPLLDDRSRYLIYYGGAGSGKSVGAAQKIIIRMLEEKGHKFLVVRKVANTIRNSVFSLLRGTIADWGLSQLFKVNKSDMDITCVNGNQIIFAGLDDVEKLKSIHGITGMWLEEASEMLQEDFQQLDLRLRGQTRNYKQIIISFNPIDITHWLKRVFFDVKKANSKVIHSTYKDNIFIDDEYKKTLESLKEQDEYFYQVYALGQWGVLGKTIFPARIVSERIAYLRDYKPLKRGYFVFEAGDDSKPREETIKWVSDDDGAIEMYEDVKGKFPYVLGGDTAGEGSDYFSAHVIDNTTGKQVARLHQQYDEIDYTQQIYCLGRHYNMALIGLEVNFSTYPTRKLEEWKYTKMYVREAQDSFTHKLEKRFGFMTGKVTRPLIIANLVTIVKESSELIYDVKTLEEMLTFVKNENGRPEAQEGAHDDLIMGLAITYQIRYQQRYDVEREAKVDISKLPQDLQEDYWNAPAERRQYLLRKWGVIKAG
jgi:phage terminase large subunit